MLEGKKLEGKIRLIGCRNNEGVYCNGKEHVVATTIRKNPDYVDCISMAKEVCNCAEKEKGFVLFPEYADQFKTQSGWVFLIPRIVLSELGCVVDCVPNERVMIPKMNMEKDYSFSLYNTSDQLLDRLHYLKPGEMVTWLDYHTHRFLPDGGEVTILVGRYWDGKSTKWEEVVTNIEGELKSDNGLQYKKIFAIRKAKEISEKLNISSEQAWKIVRLSGPGAAIKSMEYAQRLIAQGHNPDNLWVLLNMKGPQEQFGFGWARAEKVLKNLGIEPPVAKNSREFFGIIRGARLVVRFLK